MAMGPAPLAWRGRAPRCRVRGVPCRAVLRSLHAIVVANPPPHVVQRARDHASLIVLAARVHGDCAPSRARTTSAPGDVNVRLHC